MSEIHRTAATLREFVHRSGALRAQALLDAEPPALVACTFMGPIEIVIGDEETELAPHRARSTPTRRTSATCVSCPPSTSMPPAAR